MSFGERQGCRSVYAFGDGFWLVEIDHVIRIWSRAERMGVASSQRDREMANFDWQLIFEIILIFITIFIQIWMAILIKVFLRSIVTLSLEYTNTTNVRI